MSDSSFTLDNHIALCNEVTFEAKRLFGHLTPTQLNWRPTPDKWSVAQCLEHLIQGNRLYFPLFAALENGTYKPSWWAKINPMSMWLGNFMVDALGPDLKRKMKTPIQATTPPSKVSGDIVARFEVHQQEFVAALAGLKHADTHVVVTSPLLAIITYPLSSCVALLVRHEQRHLLQATRVSEFAGFPGA
ncbi:MAG: DinB family protein [Bacteroidetes Order II. Incertae sedis bacterium]|nr:DinB family protein [Bacteroidetes Order II. bacterium]